MWVLKKKGDILFQSESKKECIDEAIKRKLAIRSSGDWLHGSVTMFTLLAGVRIEKI